LPLTLQFKIPSTSLTHSLTDHSRKAGDQTKQRTATFLRHKTKLITGGMWFQLACSVCALPFHWAVLLLQAAKPYQPVNFSNQHFPWGAYLDTTTLFKAIALL